MFTRRLVIQSGLATIAAPAVVAIWAPSSTRRTCPSTVESTTIWPLYEPESTYVPGAVICTVAPLTAAPSPETVADDPDRAIVVAVAASYASSSALSWVSWLPASTSAAVWVASVAPVIALESVDAVSTVEADAVALGVGEDVAVAAHPASTRLTASAGAASSQSRPRGVRGVRAVGVSFMMSSFRRGSGGAGLTRRRW